MYSSYTAFGDLEVFLHGLGLEHMTDILKVRFHLYVSVELLVNIHEIPVGSILIYE